jgi:hypothetical protein
MVFVPNGGADEHAHLMDTIGLLGQHVIPALGDEAPVAASIA